MTYRPCEKVVESYPAVRLCGRPASSKTATARCDLHPLARLWPDGEIAPYSLPMPLFWDDLCECGQQRHEHGGKHGFGRSAKSGCPSFKETA